MSAVIGIDLGTSTTEAAVFRNGRVDWIPNPEGGFITPSAVGLDEDGNWVCGARARAQRLLRPENTALEVKRKTGLHETISLGRAAYAPVELQGRLLSYVRAYVCEYLGENVDRAVISVPAYFGDAARRETIQAGEMAGFSVERILNEPTAAALSYGLSHMEEESHVLVYDLGGGTFDVTLLEMVSGVLDVKASAGDNRLGGKDFDEALLRYLLDRFRAKTGRNLEGDRQAAARLREEAEACKIALSEQESFRVLLPALATVNGSPVGLDETVTRAQFEAMTRHLLLRTHAPIDRVLSDAELSASQIDRIILVGGATRMPMVSEDIRKTLGQDPEPAVNPDLAVSEGAAILAGIIEGTVPEEDSPILTDVCPFTLGIRAADGWDTNVMSSVIPRNTTIPTQRQERYRTFHNQQTAAQIEVYQGESRIADHNQFLGEFLLRGIPPGPAGKEALDVTFSYDLNGILAVTAVIASTGGKASIEIDMGKPREAQENVSGWKDAEGAKAYRAVIRRTERALAEGGLPDGLRERADDLLYDLKAAILKGDGEAADRAETILTRLLKEAKEQP